MFWQQRPNPTNWIDQIRYFTDHNNRLSEDELRDAFINLAHLYVTDFSNLMVLEDAIVNEFGDEGEEIIKLRHLLTLRPTGHITELLEKGKQSHSDRQQSYYRNR